MSIIYMSFVVYVWEESNMYWHMHPVLECMCVYVYIHTHTHTHTYIYIYIHTCLNTCMWGVQLKTEPRHTVRFMALHILFYIWSK